MSETLIIPVEQYVKNTMGNEIAHDFKHVDRVRHWALRIAHDEGYADTDAITIAALLHDIGLLKAEKRRFHGEVGAAMAQEYLQANTSLPPEKISEICDAIRFHNTNRAGDGPLINIIRDADILDLFGAVGIMRAFTSKATLPEYDPTNVLGETWGMTAADFDKRFDAGVGIGATIVDQINFQISCYDNLKTPTAQQLAEPLIADTKAFLLKLSDIHSR